MGAGEPNAGLAIGKGEDRRGLVRATAGWSLFRKLSFTWLYLCFSGNNSLIISRVWYVDELVSCREITKTERKTLIIHSFLRVLQTCTEIYVFFSASADIQVRFYICFS